MSLVMSSCLCKCCAMGRQALQGSWRPSLPGPVSCALVTLTDAIRGPRLGRGGPGASASATGLPGVCETCGSRKPISVEVLGFYCHYPHPGGTVVITSLITLPARKYPTMQPVISALLAFVVALFRSRAALCLENLALRHQVAVYKQTVPRPRLHPTDRLFWVCLAQLWSGWQVTLAFVKPRTVSAWQRKRFREHWRRLSQQGKPCRPAMAKDVSDLIRMMWQANPTWGSPRIVGELRKLGIEVAKSRFLRI